MLLGEILSDKFDLTSSDIENALEVQLEVGGYLGQILINMGLVSEQQLMEVLSMQLGIPLYDKQQQEVHDGLLIKNLESLIDVEYILKRNFFPLKKQGDVLLFITNDPLNNTVLDYLTKTLNNAYSLLLATEQTINELSRAFRDDRKGVVSLSFDGSAESLKEMAAEAPVIRFLNNLLNNAVELHASDLHLEPSESLNHIRFRIDGVMHEIDAIDEKLFLSVVSRVKLLAGLDIAEKRLPQDGKFSTKIAATLIDVRVSSIPFAVGEGVVMRLLYRQRLTFDITKLGVERDVLPTLNSLINMPYGILLVTGPTGSGKTTSLYSMITSLDRSVKKIITVEDPVEYKLDGINQIQVKSDIGLTFASSLRSILRHDPDVIMIGEIRDPETAQVAVQSALTGHLVLSTLHTNDAPGSLYRLVEMGIEPYLLNASVIGIIAQRIVRRSCPFCAKPHDVSDEIKHAHNLFELFERYTDIFEGTWNFTKGDGCRRCAGTGYRGMIAIFETFKYTEDLKEVFLKAHNVDVIRTHLIKNHRFRRLREDGFIKAIKGVTTIEEVLRVT
ncbi:MAG: Flp pilus assembly complex ATPase component TadA [Candidatus Magnetoovum sp. WYHC-5]|nr:Flp pilus assembly complex ATPase component TadA [Candidatus Magnetoovum sp. WYHC-5]